MSIRVLPLNVSNFISAGEIIHNSASVVKELIENSIDSGATRIEIDIEKGGMQLISVKDNGCGMNKNDLSLSLVRHSTSKIFSIKDLNNIDTLGFRGEALSSINAVSRIMLMSCNHSLLNSGWRIYSNGKNVISGPDPIAHSKGTTIIIFDLFFNQPIRRQFVKSEYLEFVKIDEVVRRLSLSMNNISFSLKHNNKLMRYYHNSDCYFSMTNRINLICGFNFISKSRFIKYKFKKFKIEGWIYLYNKNSSAKKIQYSYVNRRFVSSKIIRHAIFQAVQEIYDNRFNISYIIYLKLNSNDLDVNIHPEKKEIKFLYMRYVHSFIYQTVFNSLNIQNKNSTDNFGNNNWILKNRMSAGDNVFIEKNLNKKNVLNTLCEINHFKDYDVNNESLSKHYKTFNFNAHPSIFGNLLTLIRRKYLLVERNDELFICSLPIAKILIYKNKLKLGINKGLKIEKLTKLLIIIINKEQYELLKIYYNILFHVGLCFNFFLNLVELHSIPSILFNQNLKNLVKLIFDHLFFHKKINLLDVVTIITNNITIPIVVWDHLQIISVLSEFKKYCKEYLKANCISKLLQPININSALSNCLKYEY